LKSAGRLGDGRHGGRTHEPKPLEQDHGSLGRPAPHQLAAVALAILYINVPAGILQAAVFELAVDENSVVEDQMLAFEGLVFVSGHR
jgi:hypothetical protein